MHPVDLGNKVYMIDLMEQNRVGRSASYVILGEQPTVIETGSAVSHDILVGGLHALGLSPSDLSYVIVTHVHLDHAGGAGHLMEKAPRAQLVVHPRGARHMADPSKLWSGAAGVYGDQLQALFGSVKPVSESQILVKAHGETLDIGSRTLTFFDSPGHAKHHFTILDPISKALFAGDALGIRYRTFFTGWDFEWVMPSTSPIDFDPEAIRKTTDMLREVPFDWVYHTHFGRSPKQEAIDETARCGQELAQWIGRVYASGISAETVMSALREWIVEDLHKRGLKAGENIEVLDIDVTLDALGLMYYEEKRRSS